MEDCQGLFAMGMFISLIIYIGFDVLYNIRRSKDK